MKKITAFIIFSIILGSCGQQNTQDGKEGVNTVPQIEEVAVQPEDTKNEQIQKGYDDTKLNEPEDTDAVEGQEVILSDYEVNTKNWGIDPIGDVNDEIVLLTIDDAPEKYSLEMAQTLKDLGVNAIFFVNGHFINTETEKENLKKIYDMGFVIGNHTMTHANLSNLTKEEQRKEMINLNDLVEEVTGERPTFFRAPYGVNTDYSNALALEEGMQVMNWTYGYDWEKEYLTKDALLDIMVNTPLLKNGANLLMHDRAWTNEALHDIVQGLQSKGFDMVDPNRIQTPNNNTVN